MRVTLHDKTVYTTKIISFAEGYCYFDIDTTVYKIPVRFISAIETIK